MRWAMGQWTHPNLTLVSWRAFACRSLEACVVTRDQYSHVCTIAGQLIDAYEVDTICRMFFVGHQEQYFGEIWDEIHDL